MPEFVTETVSVDEAISKANKMVNYPIMGIFFGLLGISFYLTIENIMPGWVIAIGFVSAFIFAWLWWSIMVTKWRIWAFENVRNVHELKKKAIRAKIIWPDDSFFVKTEIRTAADKQKLESLQSKFLKEDLFVDDVTIPDETIIYYSKSSAIVNCLIGVGIAGFGIYMVKANSPIIGWVLIAFGLYSAYTKYKKEVNNTEPQITLNKKGIQSAGTPFYDWNEVSNEDVIVESSGKSSTSYLVYDCPDKSVRFDIEDLKTSVKELRTLLDTYRGRSEQKH